MCDRRIDADKRASETLAKLMNRELGSNIDPIALRLFILHHWLQITKLAHAIHDTGGSGDKS